MIPERWLILAALAIGSSQAILVLFLFTRNAWVEWRLRRLRRRSRLLEEIFAELDAGASAVVREELGRGGILADIRSLEQWLDLVVRRGDDPAQLAPEQYEETGLVERYLTELREQRRWARRAAAAEILGWTRSPRAVDALLETALDTVGEPPPVRSVALRSLERIHHPDAAPRLIAALATAETWFLPRAASVLVKIGDGAVDPLIRELRNADRPASTRRWAAHILGEIGDRRALRVLHEVLSDVDPELRARAAKALGRLRDTASVPTLLERLVNDPSPFVRTSVAGALAQLPTRETVEFLARSLSDPEWWVRLRAVESLAGLGSPARDTLRGALHDRDPAVAREAARALERMGVVAEAIASLENEGYTPEVAELLHDIGVAGSLDTVLDALREADAGLATQLVRILGRVGDRRAGPALAERLDRAEDTGLQTRLVQALQRVGARGFDDRMYERLASPDEWVRVSCLEYLEVLGDPSRLPDLTPLLNEENAGVRCAALRLVKRLRPASVSAESLLPGLGDLDPAVRAAAARAIAAIGRHDLLLAHDIAADEDRVVRALLAALGPAGTGSLQLVRVLFARAQDAELEPLAVLVRDVARQDPEGTWTALRDGGDDPAARWALATAAIVLIPAGFPVDLRPLMGDEDSRTRAAALQSAPHVNDGALLALVAPRCADRAPLVVAAAVRALVLVPDANVEDRYLAALRRGNAHIAAEVALALGIRGTLQGAARRQLEPLSDDRAVRVATIVARLAQGERDVLPDWLDVLRSPRSLRVLRGWREQRHPLFAILVARTEEAAVPFVVRLVAAESAYDAELMLLHELERSPEPEARRACVDGLRALGSRRAEGVLISTCLVDPSPRVRSAALEFLVTQTEHPQRLGLIEHALRDPEETVRVLAADRTAELQPGEAIPLLLRHIETDRPRFRAALVRALTGYAVEFLPAIAKALRGKPESARKLRALVSVLEGAPDPWPEGLAAHLLRHRWAPVRAHALARLAPRLGDAAADPVLSALRDPAGEVRHAAVRWLADRELAFGDRETERAPALVAALQDPSERVRARAIRGVAALGIPEARRPLRRLARSDKPRIARMARAALETLDAGEPAGSAS